MRTLILPFLLSAAGWAQTPAVAVDIHSVIHPITVDILTHAIDQAARDHAPFVLVRLNTPGGLLNSTGTLVEKICASPVPVVTFVEPTGGRAASAGFFLLLAGDVAAMMEGTRTGAASPVVIGGEMDPVMRRKVENDSAAAIRSLAVRRNRNPAMAQAAVLEAKSFTSQEALDQKLIDMVVRDQNDLLARLDGREITRCDGRKQVLHTAGVAVSGYELSWRERLVTPLADPNLAFVLLVVGGLLLYIEFTSPGMIAPGVAGAILVVVALLALSVLPINLAGVALLLLSAVLFALELKIASHGVLAVGGTVSMILGAVLLIEGPPEVRIRLSTAVSVAVPFALIAGFLVTLVVRARLRPVVTGSSGMLLETGVAKTDLNPGGTVFVHGELWSAVADAPIASGTPVRVTSIDGLRLKVEPLSPQS